MKVPITLDQALALGLVSRAALDAARGEAIRNEVVLHVEAQHDAVEERRRTARSRRSAALQPTQGKTT